MNYYNINTALFNYVSLRASSTVAFHPTVKTVGFPGLHFVKINPHNIHNQDQCSTNSHLHNYENNYVVLSNVLLTV